MPGIEAQAKTLSDNEIVLRYQETGTELYLNELFARYRPRLLAFIRSRNQQNESDDILQEAEIGIARGIHKCDSSRSIQAWIFGITGYKIADAQRFQCRRSRDVQLSVFANDDDAFAMEAGDPAEIVIAREEAEADRDVFWEGMGTLQDHHREVLLERLFWDRRNQDIAETSGMSEQHVANCLFDAKQKLRKFCKDAISRRDSLSA